MAGMAARVLFACGMICVTCGRLGAQESGLTVLVKGGLTTSSQVFPYPHAEDPFLRAQVHLIDNAFGSGIEIKYQFPETNIAVGVSADYLRVTRTFSLINSFSLPVGEGYSVVPVEATGYFLVPFSGKTISVFMGAGAGAYFGSRIYRIAGTEAAAVGRKPGFGIHVLGGVSVRVLGPLVVAGEMKFRDLQFESTNRFAVNRITYGKSIVHVSSEPFVSSIHTDGIIFQLGVGIAF